MLDERTSLNWHYRPSLRAGSAVGRGHFGRILAATCIDADALEEGSPQGEACLAIDSIRRAEEVMKQVLRSPGQTATHRWGTLKVEQAQVVD